MFFVIRSDDSFNFPLGWIKHIVILCSIYLYEKLHIYKFLVAVG